MPSKSKAQQRFMGMVHSYKKGEMKNASPSVKKAASTMSKKSAKDYASTTHKGKPEKVKKESIKISKERLQELVDEELLIKLMEKNLCFDLQTEACWKGYTQKGMKTMFGKKYPNCVKKEEKVEENLTEAPGDEPQIGTYGQKIGAPNTPEDDGNIELYQKSVKALNMWVSQKGRPSQKTWRGGAGSFEEVVKRLYPDESKYVMAKAWTIPIREIPYYYGQLAGEPEGSGGEYGGSETTGKKDDGGGTQLSPTGKKVK